MPISTFNDFSTTASSNVDVNGISIQGTAPVQNFDNSFRELMAILRRDLDNGIVLTSKSAGYTAVANDNNAVIRFSAAATLSLTAAATLGSGWHAWVMADGGAVVIDPNSSETINGATTITIPDGYSTLVICDGTNFRALEDYATVSAALATKQDNSGELYRGQINGLALTNNGSDATNDIDIASGSAGSDGTTPVLMTLASALTKRLDASWAVGTGNGGLDTGAVSNATYYVWLIQRSDTGVVDALFSLSSSSPTMPSNYDRKRRIGSFARLSATNGAPRSYSQEDTGWTSYTPTFTGFGTVSASAFFWKRVEDTLYIKGRFTVGTPTATEARVSFPTGMTTTTDNGGTYYAGAMTFTLATAGTPNVLCESGVTYLTMGIQNASLGGVSKRNGNAMAGAGDVLTLGECSVRIDGWQNA